MFFLIISALTKRAVTEDSRSAINEFQDTRKLVSKKL